MSKKDHRSAHSSVESVRAAERTLSDAVDRAKQLKAKSREAKKKLKQAKKAARSAAKVARAARKDAQKARRQLKKVAARVEKTQAKRARPKIAAKRARARAEPAIVTPRGTSSTRRAARRPSPAPIAAPPGVDFDEAFSDADLKASEPH